MTALQISNLKFAWGEKFSIIIDNLAIATGEHIFLQGPSGSGKTTLLGLIGGILEPSQGKIELIGRNICELTGSERDTFRADHIGFIFQMFNLLPYLSVLENVALPCRFSKIRAKKAEDAGGVKAEARRLLFNLGLSTDSILNRPVVELSVGQQQRVAAARALIGSPEIIVADEPTSALDAETRSTFIDLLFHEVNQTKDTTVFFVSHDSSLATKFSRQLSLLDLIKQGGTNL